jgi:hypothetical protein
MKTNRHNDLAARIQVLATARADEGLYRNRSYWERVREVNPAAYWAAYIRRYQIERHRAAIAGK